MMYKYLTIASVLASMSAPSVAEVTIKTNTDSNSKLNETFNKELDSNNDGTISTDERLNSNSVSVESDTESTTTTNTTTDDDGPGTRQFYGTDTGINANVDGVKAGVGGSVSTGVSGGAK